jgi:hypothetical protein
MNSKYKALIVVLFVIVFGVFVFVLYGSHKQQSDVLVTLYKPSIVPLPATKLRAFTNTKNTIALLHSKQDNLTEKYCEKYGIDYFFVPENTWQHLFHLLRSNEYEYAVVLDASVQWIPNNNKPLQRIIQQSGDSELIVSRDATDCSQINSSALILRNTEWSQYKCIQLYLEPQNIQRILMDQVYTSFGQPKNLLKGKKQLDSGLPFNLRCTCVYNEKAFELNHAVANMYPWKDVPGFIEVPKKVLKTKEDTRNFRIPKVLYQTMSSTLLNTDRYKFSVQDWQRLNPEYDYYYFDELDCRKFLEQHFDYKVNMAYNMLLPGAFQADLFRYCLLYINGGCYVDSQVQPLLPLSTVIEPEHEFVSAIDKTSFSLWQGFLCCSPQHPVLKLAIDEAVENVLRRKYFASALNLTGPNLLGMCLNKWLLAFKYRSLKRKLPLTIKLLNHSLLTQPYIKHGNAKFLLTKYYFNKKQLSTNKFNIYQISGKEYYGTAFRNRRVFKLSLLL